MTPRILPLVRGFHFFARPGSWVMGVELLPGGWVLFYLLPGVGFAIRRPPISQCDRGHPVWERDARYCGTCGGTLLS